MTAAIFGCRARPDGRRARLLPRRRSAGLHPVRAQHRYARAARCRLVEELRSCVARAEAPVLIDQEGGRVARLRPPHWRKAPPAPPAGRALCARSRDAAWKRRGSIRGCWRPTWPRSAATSIACRCSTSRFPETHAVIGDRAYADQPEPVAALGRAAAEGPDGRRRHAGDQAHSRPRPRHRRFAHTRCRRVTRVARRCWSAPTSCRSSCWPTCRGR